MNKETYYFSHDYNARNDHKIKRLISKHGYLGYGLFWAIIEDLYQNNNNIQLDYETLSYDYRADETTLKSIILDFDLFVIENNSFGSISIQNRLDKRNEKSKTARDNAKKRWGENTSRIKADNCIFYVLSFFNENERFLKCGLTTESISRRYSGKTANYKYEVLKQVECSLDEAMELEKLVSVNCIKYEPKNNFGGYLECYNFESLSKIIEIAMQIECKGNAKFENGNAIKERKGKEIKGNEYTEAHQHFAKQLFDAKDELDAIEVSTRKKPTPDTLKRFNANLVNQNKHHNHYSEYKKHFISWLIKQPETTLVEPKQKKRL